jgi:hypothetical protein
MSKASPSSAELKIWSAVDLPAQSLILSALHRLIVLDGKICGWRPHRSRRCTRLGSRSSRSINCPKHLANGDPRSTWPQVVSTATSQAATGRRQPSSRRTLVLRFAVVSGTYLAGLCGGSVYPYILFALDSRFRDWRSRSPLPSSDKPCRGRAQEGTYRARLPRSRRDVGRDWPVEMRAAVDQDQAGGRPAVYHSQQPASRGLTPKGGG